MSFHEIKLEHESKMGIPTIIKLHKSIWSKLGHNIDQIQEIVFSISITYDDIFLTKYFNMFPELACKN